MRKRFLSVLLSSILLISTVPVSASATSVNQFTDVKRSDWYYPAVEYAVSNGLFGGTSNTTFSPNDSMTRGMFVTVLGRKSQIAKEDYQDGHFSDVPADAYYAPYVNWASENGIVKGTGNGKFTPNASITREQAAKILYEYARKTGNDTYYNDSRFQYYFDKSKASPYAVEALQWATTHAIINGTDDGYLIPHYTADRSQIAQILYCAEKLLVNTEITDTPNPTDSLVTLKNEEGEPVMTIPLPSTWTDRFTATVRGDGLGVTFYHADSLYAGYRGMLVQIMPYSDPSDYAPIPSTHFLAKINVDGISYDIVWRTPTDIQFDMEQKQVYQQMQGDIPRMMEEIEFFVPKAQ